MGSFVAKAILAPEETVSLSRGGLLTRDRSPGTGKFPSVIDSGLVLGGVPREQKMLKGHPLRVVYYQVY